MSTRSTGKFLYEEIYETLRNEILQGHYLPDNKFPSERLLKERFSASHLTIRKSLAKLVADSLVIREGGKGTTVIYSRNTGPLPNTKENIEQVCVIVDSLNEYYANVVSELERVLRKRKIRTQIFCHDLDRTTEQDMFRTAMSIPKSLIFLFPSSSTLPWMNTHAPLHNIVIGGYITNIDAPQICSEDSRGSMLATTLLINHGHRKIGHISSDFKTSGRLRKIGYTKALQAASIAFDDTLVENGSYTFEGGYSACKRILSAHPDCRAFFCASDFSAFGAIKYLKEANLWVGRDYSIIGYGNVQASAFLGLSSVDQNIDKQINQFLNFLEEYTLTGSITKGEYLIPTNLVLRESCIKTHVSTSSDGAL